MAKSKLIFDGSVYNVKERMTDENGIHGEWDDNPDWYEYEVAVIDPKTSQVVDEWNSLSETYNGVQMLTKDTATKAMNEVRRDVEAGKAWMWFNRVPEPVSVPRKIKKKTRGVQAASGGLRGVR